MKADGPNDFERIVGVYRPSKSGARRDFVLITLIQFVLMIMILPFVLNSVFSALTRRWSIVFFSWPTFVAGCGVFMFMMKGAVSGWLSAIEVERDFLRFVYKSGLIKIVKLSEIVDLRLEGGPSAGFLILYNESDSHQSARVPAWFPENEFILKVLSKKGLKPWGGPP